MFCEHCGAQNKENSAFCKKCGKPLTATHDITNDMQNSLVYNQRQIDQIKQKNKKLIIAFIIGMILAMQFMTGSIEAKSKVKESLIPYIAGCVVIFGAFGIWKLVVIILRNI